MFAACSRVNAATVSNWLSHFVGQIEEQLNEPASHMLSCRLSASSPSTELYWAKITLFTGVQFWV